MYYEHVSKSYVPFLMFYHYFNCSFFHPIACGTSLGVRTTPTYSSPSLPLRLSLDLITYCMRTTLSDVEINANLVQMLSLPVFILYLIIVHSSISQEN